MRQLIDALGLECKDEQKILVCYKLGALFGSAVYKNSLFKENPEEFKSKCQSDISELIGDTIPGTNQEFTKEIMQAMFNMTDFPKLCSQL